jgi:hypothetical protein
MNISYAFNNKISSDFTVENDDGTEVLHLHKIILLSNEYFNTLFSNNFKKVDKLCFDNIDVPRMLIYYIYTKKIDINIVDLYFDELIMILILANEWLMLDYVNNITIDYLNYFTPDIDQLMKLNIYCKDILTQDKAIKIINNDICKIVSGEHLLKYKDIIDIENLNLESKIILYTNFKEFKNLDLLFNKYKYKDIYDILIKLRNIDEKTYNIYSDFYNFTSKNVNNILDLSCELVESNILSRNSYNMKKKKYIIESIYPLSLRKLKLLRENSYVYRIKKSKEKVVIIKDIQSKINKNDLLILADPINYMFERRCIIPNILKIKVNDIEVSSANKHETVVIEIDKTLDIDEMIMTFIYKKSYLYSI